MRRVAIIGPGGAGKTTLATELGQTLGIEVVQLDRMFWLPGWVWRPLDEWEELQQQALQRDAWIADSASWLSMRARFEAADTIVFLDLPPLRCAVRAFRRRIRTRGRHTPDMAPGCFPARLDRAALNYARYVLRYRREIRPQILAELDRLSTQRRVVVLRNARQVRRFARSLRTPATDAAPEHA